MDQNLEQTLPAELSNLVGNYTDEKTYETLNQLDPKIYTSDKLFLKHLEGTDRGTILKLVKVEQWVSEYISRRNDEKRIDPLLLTGLALICIRTNEDIDSIGDTTVREHFHIEIEKKEKEVEEEITDTWLFWDQVISRTNNEISQKLDKISTSGLGTIVLRTAYLQLLEEDSDVYPTTALFNFADKMAPYILSKFELFSKPTLVEKKEWKYSERLQNFLVKYNINQKKDQYPNEPEHPNSPYEMFVLKNPWIQEQTKFSFEEIWSCLSVKEIQKYERLSLRDEIRFMKHCNMHYILNIQSDDPIFKN